MVFGFESFFQDERHFSFIFNNYESYNNVDPARSSVFKSMSRSSNKKRVRELTRRTRGVSIEERASELGRYRWKARLLWRVLNRLGVEGVEAVDRAATAVILWKQ